MNFYSLMPYNNKIMITEITTTTIMTALRAFTEG